ncbi:hypothetical protein [Pseudomonas hamedanensis]|uniref:Uncharacterized protein n=1 Tax=Pseudomonas hamedanensis TaxID=2745504 RepID=A0A9E6P483_9PSED|nr:hypothetical protein [Pseudomonas hamedanensis]QXI19150.1 hypothetical protein HU739_009205 [Pseudomonas hamedanensis]
MKTQYKIVDIKNLLFVFDIENTRNDEREKIIVSKDVNDDKELGELFDVLLKPEFLCYTYRERTSLADTVAHFLGEEDSFDRVFERMTTYFDEDVRDQRRFMSVLLECLTRYQAEASSKTV